MCVWIRDLTNLSQRSRIEDEQVVSHLLKSTLMPLAHFLLLVGLHFLVVEVLRCTLDVVETEFGMLLRFVGVIE